MLALLFSTALANELSEEQKLKQSKSYTKVLNVQGREGILYFAQNSPEWQYLQFSEVDNNKDKFFGQTSCIVTTLSIALANLVPQEELSKIEKISKGPFRVDTISTTKVKGLKPQYRFTIERDEDYLRFFPLVLANWASGNNTKSINENQSTFFYKILFDFYGINHVQTKDINESFKAIDEGGIVITSSGGVASPISKRGHYFLMVNYDDEYVYFVDPYVRSKPYPDTKRIVEKVSDGIIKVKHGNIKHMCLNLQYALYPREDSPNYTQAILNKIFEKSNNNINAIKIAQNN